MIRTVCRPICRPRLTTSLLAAIFALAALNAPAAWAVGFGGMPAAISFVAGADEDAPDEAAPLIAVGDFNRDGIADIAEADSPAGDPSGLGILTVSLGQADGSYRQMVSHLALGHTPRSIASGDFNGDGIPDLIVGDEDGEVTLFLGDGTGNLVPAGDIAHLDSAVSIAVADFNHDGIPDIAVSDWRASTVTVLLGAGNGSFRRTWSFPLKMPGKIAHISTADFNRDGIPDLAVVYDDDAGDTFEVMLGNGNGTFTDAPDLSFARNPNAHCAT
jgi:FG-GAP-like repeat